ncbi:hypothetical protein Pcinc_041329 [Petrolisthes cinctipes]|uniref:Coiled-coil domain-containing protein 43 n=1 Tax=Petrolisthes cinctipes TaxID=88211 RepID=A0AAE1BMA0_PETCI|nr:hypothetical protein Pcinc_041329 [Petrolisthes cinctipes]KAK3852069.1 hypothetical protein Pcinc_041329 [Petrolisthes cinctipes]
MAEAAEGGGDKFDSWLRKQLIDLSTDDDVFTPYIKGILEGDDNNDDKKEALQAILVEIMDNGIEDLCSNILHHWSLRELSTKKENTQYKVAVEDKLVEIMEKQQQQKQQQKQQQQPTKQQQQQQQQQANDRQILKNAILAQYGQVSDGDVTDSDDEGGAIGGGGGGGSGGGGGGGGGLGLRNTNAEDVARAEREKRERDKEESQRKKDKDKEDRAKQKSRDEDRKEKEKKRTQKGERRR